MPIEKGLSAKICNERLLALGGGDEEEEASLKKLQNENALAIADRGGVQDPPLGAIMDEDDGMEMTKAASDDEGGVAIGRRRLPAPRDGPSMPPASAVGLVHAPPPPALDVAAPDAPSADARHVIDYASICGMKISKRAAYRSGSRRQAARWTLPCPYSKHGHDGCTISRAVHLDPDRYSGCCQGPFFFVLRNSYINMFGAIL